MVGAFILDKKTEGWKLAICLRWQIWEKHAGEFKNKDSVPNRRIKSIVVVPQWQSV